MGPFFEQVCCASVDPADLVVLADLRAEGGIRVSLIAERAWVRWDAGNDEVLRRVLPLRGVALYARRDDHWYRPGHHLPAFGVPLGPGDAGMPLSQAIVPAPIRVAVQVPDAVLPARLGLTRDAVPRVATALRCRLSELAAWAESAPTSRLSSLAGAVSGERVMVLGSRLPELPDAERFWGDGVFLPLGHRSDPELPAPALREVFRVSASDYLVLATGGFEAISSEVFRPLTRSGVRLAVGGLPA
jgi:hypothetical protein